MEPRPAIMDPMRATTYSPMMEYLERPGPTLADYLDLAKQDYPSNLYDSPCMALSPPPWCLEAGAMVSECRKLGDITAELTEDRAKGKLVRDQCIDAIPEGMAARAARNALANRSLWQRVKDWLDRWLG